MNIRNEIYDYVWQKWLDAENEGLVSMRQIFAFYVTAKVFMRQKRLLTEDDLLEYMDYTLDFVHPDCEPERLSFQ